MLDEANYTPRLKAVYKDTIRAAIKEEFSYKNDMQIPRLDKIVLNIGAGRAAVKDSKKPLSAAADLTAISGQKAMVTRAKKSIAGFRLREEMPVGAKVTLRGDKMYEFLDRLITIAMQDMAKKSMIEREKKRERLVKKYAAKRAALLAIANDREKPMEERFKARLKLAELPRNSSAVRLHNRCQLTGRPHAYYRKLKISRIALRDLGSSGQIPGMVKSSW